ncbi:MAG: response regulator [Candidatus Omnitrophica bacterium]|nr:response regulator [Candidatus Omnitrophota bacterium]
MSNKRILIVDDEPDILRVAVFRLKKAGFEVATAINGQEGLEMAKKEKPDLIFLDLRLPVMDGYELCHELKTNDDLKHIPIILLTASAAQIGTRARQMGADDFITKPFDTDHLIKKAKKFTKTSD